MKKTGRSSTLVDFPCDYEFKAFGPGDARKDFVASVQQAAGAIVPITLGAMRIRHSQGGKYLCVTLLVRLHNQDQLNALYNALRGIPDLVYLL